MPKHDIVLITLVLKYVIPKYPNIIHPSYDLNQLLIGKPYGNKLKAIQINGKIVFKVKYT